MFYTYIVMTHRNQSTYIAVDMGDIWPRPFAVSVPDCVMVAVEVKFLCDG
jgi:hypothetical protein